MHLNIAHAIVTAGLILATFWVLGRVGIIEKGAERRFDWRVTVSIAVVIFVFNLIWPL